LRNWKKAPSTSNTYRLSNLSLWNAAATGMSAQDMIDVLQRYSKFPLSANLPPRSPSSSAGMPGQADQVHRGQPGGRRENTPKQTTNTKKKKQSTAGGGWKHKPRARMQRHLAAWLEELARPRQPER